MKYTLICQSLLGLCALAPTTLVHAVDTASQDPTQLPLFVNQSVAPLNMLVVGRDHRLFFPAYNDASDLDGDGVLDIHYKPSIDYMGYFDSHRCYAYDTGKNYFTPKAATADKTCSSQSGARWSGDFLNYLTTSRIDALRKVLYGGYRSTDSVSQTILERAYIPKDAHTWGKEYSGVAIDGYDLSQYTPLSVPSAGNYTLFASTSIDGVPRLRILANQSGYRIWGWVSREQTQGQNTITSTAFKDRSLSAGDFAYDLTVRVEACVSGLQESNCKRYPNGQFKPTGLLHDYGEDNQMYFGLLTGTYDNNLQGGALRKAVSSFANEVNGETGIFGKASDAGGYAKQGIVATLDGIAITDNGTCPSGTTITNGSCYNWGNPLGEMSYEALRYFAGATPTAGYAAGSVDASRGLPSVKNWTNPYAAQGTAANPDSANPTYPRCSRPFQTLISDINPNYDSELPGSAFGGGAPAEGTLAGLDVATLGQAIWMNELSGSRKINIGEVLGMKKDNAPTAKIASSFGTIRGLPEEPTKQGTYNTASVAYFANTHDITTSNQKVKTFAVALSSSLPRIQMSTSKGNITLVPFGKAVRSGTGNSNNATEQLTGFYVDTMANMDGKSVDLSVNSGYPYLKFRVVFDDVGQGGDYDMDAIVLYTLAANADGTISITTSTEYSVSGTDSHMGYTIAGTGDSTDGIYLEVTGGGNGNSKHELDTPDGKLPGDCITQSCSYLPGRKNNSVEVNGGTFHTRRFTPSRTNIVTNLMDPLWYAAKWGGFNYSTDKPLPVAGEWDSNRAGTPNNYFLVTNAATLKEQMSKAFNQILQNNSSVGRPVALPKSGTESDYGTFTTTLDIKNWSGDLIRSGGSGWKASEKMSNWAWRKILMANSNGSGLEEFTFDNLKGRTFAGIDLQSNLDGSKVNFIKGDVSQESLYRKRTSLIGDIVNSGPVVVGGAQYLAAVADSLNGKPGDYAAFKAANAGRKPQVYVGANDGMLHAFDAKTGQETFAFIPTPVIPNLYRLADSNYNTDSSLHRYYVDGTPVVADVYIGNAWRTVLIGTLRGGGRGVFALDVTSPDNVSLLWEYTSQDDADLGYTFATPVVSRLHNGKWAVLLGNGYNSSNGNASLIVLDVASGSRIAKLTTSASGNNGLSSVRAADVNGDGVADYAYAGDLQGNLWRFDLFKTGSAAALEAASISSTSEFAVAFGNQPLYRASTPGQNPVAQAITAPPSLVRHPSRTGYIVIFGTGRYFTAADKQTDTLQTLYGVWDRRTAGESTVSAAAVTRKDLVAQTISQVDNATFGAVTRSVRTVTQNPVDWSNVDGWVLDLKVGTELLGERITDEMYARGNVLFVTTRTPSPDPCQAGLTGWTYGIDPYTGGRTAFNVFDLSRDGVVGTDDQYNDSVISGLGTSAGGIALGNDKLADSSGDLTTVSFGPNVTGRQSWRVIPEVFQK